jgi:hypothetical protein
VRRQRPWLAGPVLAHHLARDTARIGLKRAVAGQPLAQAWAAGWGPRAGPDPVDLESTNGRAYRLQRDPVRHPADIPAHARASAAMIRWLSWPIPPACRR